MKIHHIDSCTLRPYHNNFELQSLNSNPFNDNDIPVQFVHVSMSKPLVLRSYTEINPSDIYFVHNVNQMTDTFNKIITNDVANRFMRATFNHYNYENVKAFALKYMFSDITGIQMSFSLSEVIKCLKLYLSHAVNMHYQDWVVGHNFIRDLVIRYDNWYNKCQKYIVRECII